MNKSIVLITDVPTPYRIHHYGKLYKAFQEKGIDFRVEFMALTVPIRFWTFESNDFGFPYKIRKGLRIHVSGNTYHFNPMIIVATVFNKPDILFVGGAWNIPSSFLSIFAFKFFALEKRKVMLWSEANRHSVSHSNRFFDGLRNYINSFVDAFIVPGELAVSTIRHDWGQVGKSFFKMPNLIDDDKFRANIISPNQGIRSFREELKIANDQIVAIWPARLHEETKGIINFLSAVREIVLGSNLRILIAGGGPDEQKIDSWVKEHLSEHVTLLGQRIEKEMLLLYKEADILFLPSMKDPNPLTVIEGLWSSLPVLISSHCGNFIEAVEEGVNGWVVNPNDQKSMKSAVGKLLGSEREDFRRMGARSVEIAHKEFQTDAAVARFVDEVTKEVGG